MEVENIRSLNASVPGRLDCARRVFGRPLTLTETTLVTRAADLDRQQAKPGKDNR